LLGFGALFASSFIWDNTNVYIQLGYKGYGWQTLVIAFLLLSFIVSMSILISQTSGREFINELGKFKLIIVYCVCCATMIIASALESWYSTKAHRENYHLYYPRFVIVTVSFGLLHS
uniref:DUF4153 domain-containing protein n=1 Tax=Enterobius vermicularis TaxID=51028 RepID=A0A0N4VEC0_ENTVE